MQEVLDSFPFVEFAGVKLAKRSVYDRAAYLRKARDEGRAQLLENLKAAGITGRDMLDELRAYDAVPWGSSSAWFGFIISLDGAPRILTDAAEAFAPGRGEEVVRHLSFADEDERITLLANLCGLKFKDPTPPPTKPAASEGTAPDTTG